MKEKLKFFAANGKERTVYTVTEIGADEYKIQITMEPNRLRPDIPEFAGLYYEFDESLDLGRKQKLAVDIEFLDAGLKVLNLELKCKNDLSKKYTYYVKNDVPGQKTVKKFDLADCDYEVRRNAGQIVLATFPTDFSDMNMLSAEFILHGITFE